MKTLREHAREAWEQEQERRRHSERKKRKRRAKKIEEDIDDLLPRDAEGVKFERGLDDSRYEVVVIVTDTDDTVLRFTHNDKDELQLIGQCPSCRQDTESRVIDNTADLGEVLESFTPAQSHDCSSRK